MTLYPVLFALMPLIFLYTYNRNEVKFNFILPLMLFVGAGFTMVMILLYYLGITKTAVSAVTLGLVILFYTPAATFRRFFSRYSYQYFIKLLVVLFFLLLIAYFPVLSFILNIVAIVLTALLLISALTRKKSAPAFFDEPIQAGDSQRPDVYNILFDAYIGKDSLKYTTGFDNNAFYDELKKRGFAVPSKPYSNYNHTAASVSSMLNMGYTKDFLKESDFSSKEFLTDNRQYRLFNMVHGKVPMFFKSLGYKYLISAEPLFSENVITDHSGIIDIVIGRKKSLITGSILQTFIGMTFFSFLRSNKTMKQHAEYVREMMDNIICVPSNEGPLYAFIHVWAPHTPYVFNEDGTINEKFSTLNDLTSEDEDTKKAYVGNLKYCNKLILEMIDKLLADIDDNKKNAVILINSDHGLFKSDRRSSEYNVLVAAKANYADISNVFPDGLTLVNTYRYLLNRVFDTKLEILDNKYFYENWAAGDYSEEDITDTIKSELAND